MNKSICLYFQVHQPFRLRTYRFFDIGKNHHYFDEYFNRMILRRVAEKSYLPMNALLLKAIKENGSAFKVSFSFSGIVLEQMEMYAPEVLDSFRKLISTGQVEVLAETYAHSLSSLQNAGEFERQVKAHSEKIEQVFGIKPTSFRNTELIYSDDIGARVADMGFNIMLTEGPKHVLGWKSPNYLYTNAINPKLKLMLRNFRLSDDITFRFSQQSWPEWPITAEKFVGWINNMPEKEEVVNVFMDYETFGEHQPASTGIFEFMKVLPAMILKNTAFKFRTPAEITKIHQPISAIQVPYPISWADEERDLSAWTGNNLQDDAMEKLYSLADKINATDDTALKQDWNYLQSSDHFFYMCTKWLSDGDLHKYFNHYPSPYEAYINYMNVLSDFIIRVDEKLPEASKLMNELIDNTGKLGQKIGQMASEKIHEAEKSVKDKFTETKKQAKPVFDDIKHMSDAKVKKLIKELDAEQLVIAMKDAGHEIREKVLPNLTKKTRQQFESLHEKLSDVNKKDVQSMRKKVEEKLKKFF
ncbi:MAG: alpha-amylase [Bacteroidetes bacterium]|nr:alpha-amylase [Bacteroidota bacterium]MBU1579992.1 alpha-amylase [Bacteroidota bacterium]MBU2559023.1 alpha-amylase [Bacteroidota bacterium]